MSKKEIILKIIIILLIFSVGFFLRMESIPLNGVLANENDYYQNQNGLPYMYELDSYYNYRLTENYINHGYLGDTIINGTEWDSHSYYPGVPLDYPPLIVYITAFIYKFVNLFSQIPLLTVCFWLPIFIGPLCGIPAYFFVSRQINEYGGLIAGILVVTIPFYAIRSFPGWFDTDIFNIIFPILIIWFLIESFQVKNTKLKISFAFLSAFSMFLFATAWNGYQYLFYIILIFCISYIILNILKRQKIENIMIISLIFTFGTILLIYIFLGSINILKLIFGPLELIRLVINQNIWSPWPDPYPFISELRKPSLDDIIYGLDPIIIGLGVFGVFLLASTLTRDQIPKGILNRADWFFFLFLAIWLLIGFLALIKGVRFFLLLIPPLIISAGIATGIIIGYLNSLKRKNFAKFISISLIIIVSISPIIGTYQILHDMVPGADDDMWNGAEWINKNTEKNTVIISEWSYGHLFTAIADCPVLHDGRIAYIETVPTRKYDNNPFGFNGKSPNTSREYWVYRALSTRNQTLSVGILNMVATSGDMGSLTLDKYTKNTTKTVEILNNILGVNRDLAKKILINYQLKPAETEDILTYTHPSNPKQFVFVTFKEMVDRNYWIYDGEWDFDKVKPRNYTYSVGSIHVNGSVLNTSNGITTDLNNNNDIKWNEKTPYCYIKITNGSVMKYYLNKNSNFCIILIMDDKKSIVMDKKFENSMFTKLVIERSNSTVFKSIYENKKISVWKVK